MLCWSVAPLEPISSRTGLGSSRLPFSVRRFFLCLSVAVMSVAGGRETAFAQRPTFRSSVDVVSVTAVARDDRGRTVRDLGRDDFEIYEQGRLRRLTDFKVSDQGPVSLAILMDASGSMRVGAQLEAGRRAVEHILSWVQPEADEVSL